MRQRRVAATVALLFLLVLGCAWVAATSLRMETGRLPDPPTSATSELATAARVGAEERGTRELEAPEPPTTPATEEPDPARTIVVLVRDPSGAPVAGAVVELFERVRTTGDASLSEVASALGRPVTPITSRTTDAEGRARLTRTAASALRTVVGRRSGYARTAKDVGDSATAELVLTPGYAVEGRVVDIKGRPVAGAVVLGGPPRLRHAEFTAGAAESFLRATADDAGRFVLDGLPRGTDVFCVGWPRGVPVFAAQADIPATKTLDLVLPGGGAVEGRVTDEATGAPLADVQVSAVRTLNALAFGYATTDASGAYRIESFPYYFLNEIHVRKAGWCEVPRAMQYGHLVVPEDGTARYDLAMRPGAKLSGRVLSPSGPVASARVTAAQKGAREVARTTAVADADGRFAFDSLAAGPTVLVVAAAGEHVQAGFPPQWETAVREGTAPADATVEVIAGKETVHDIHLVPGLTVTGRVEGPDGRPASSARVELIPHGESDGPYATRTPEVDAAGAFEVRGIPSADSVTVRASADGFGTVHCYVRLDAATGAKDVVLRLTPASKLHGRAVVVEGAVLRDAVALVTTLPDPRWPEEAWKGATPRPVASDGSFELSVIAGTYVARVIAPGFAVADSEPIQVTSEKHDYSVVIPLDAGCRLAGDVVTDGGAPVARARLRMQRIDPNAPPPPPATSQPKPPLPISATSDAAGAFAVENFAPGVYDILIGADGMSPTTVRVTLPREERLRVELAPTGTIAGRIHFADGSAAAGLRVYVSAPGGAQGHIIANTDSTGAFHVDGLPVGTYSVHVSATDTAPAPNVLYKSVSGVRPGGEPIDMTVEPALSIGGTLLDDTGRPFESGTVSVFRDDREPADAFQSGQSAVTPAGRFEVRGLEPGTYTVRVAWIPPRDGVAYVGRELSRVAAGTMDAALVALPGLAIEGAVAPDESGRVAVDLIEALPAERPALGRGDSRASAWAKLDSQGRFRLEGLARGRYRLVVKSDNWPSPFQPRPADAVVEAGARDLRLVLDSSTTISGRMTFLDAAVTRRAVAATPVGGGTAISATSNDRGDFVLVGLDPSQRYELRSGAQDVAPVRVANVAPGTAGVRLVFERGLVARGRLLRADGTPIPKRGVYLRHTTSDATGYAMTADDGTFEAAGLVEGEYRAVVYVAAGTTPEGVKKNDPRDCGTVRGGDTGVELRLPQ